MNEIHTLNRCMIIMVICQKTTSPEVVFSFFSASAERGDVLCFSRSDGIIIVYKSETVFRMGKEKTYGLYRIQQRL